MKRTIIILDPSLDMDLRRQSPAIEPERAAISTKIGRLLREGRAWMKAGARLTPRGQRAGRDAACNACEFYAPEGNAFLGECRAPGCGCTKLKRLLASATCPHPQGSRWPA